MLDGKVNILSIMLPESLPSGTWFGVDAGKLDEKIRTPGNIHVDKMIYF